MATIKTTGAAVNVRQAVTFCTVGIVNFVVDLAAYFTAYNVFHVNYLVAQAVAYPCGAINSYFLNRKFTFSQQSRMDASELMRYCVLNVGSIAASMLTLYAVNKMFLEELSVSKVAANLCALCLNFVGSKMWVFRRGSHKVRHASPAPIVEQEPLLWGNRYPEEPK